jgi:hypothetical protein
VLFSFIRFQSAQSLAGTRTRYEQARREAVSGPRVAGLDFAERGDILDLSYHDAKLRDGDKVVRDPHKVADIARHETSYARSQHITIRHVCQICASLLPIPALGAFAAAFSLPKSNS